MPRPLWCAFSLVGMNNKHLFKYRCVSGLWLEDIDRKYRRFEVKVRKVGPWMSYLWQSVVRIMVWHRWNSGCVAIFFQAAILWLHVVGNQTITTNTIYVNQCKHKLCSWDPPPLFKKMFSPVQIRFLHIISTPCTLWCILKDFYISHLNTK